MWLATSFGFYAFQALENGLVAVRGHVRQDLENLRKRLELDDEQEVECIAGAHDFAYQLVITPAQVMALAAAAAAESTYAELSTEVYSTPDQGDKLSAYQELRRELLKLQLAELGDRLNPSAEDRARHESYIRENLTTIIKQSSLCGVDDAYWDVTRISWTGDEWEELSPHPGYCYVEAYEHSTPPLDYIYVISIRTGTPEYIACYEGDADYFELTTHRMEGGLLNLPEHVNRP